MALRCPIAQIRARYPVEPDSNAKAFVSECIRGVTGQASLQIDDLDDTRAIPRGLEVAAPSSSATQSPRRCRIPTGVLQCPETTPVTLPDCSASLWPDWS